MPNVLFSDRRSVDAHGNLLTITATAFADVMRVRSCVNVSTVREQWVDGRVFTQDELDASSALALRALERSASPIVTSDLPRCPASGRVL